MTRTKYAGVTVRTLRQALIYKPLVVLMSVLLLPTIPWARRADIAPPFAVSAQGGTTCKSNTNSIIQNYCTDTVGSHAGNNYYSHLAQLETDAVNAYLAAHGMPASEAHVIYDYGRADLRNAIRGHINSILLGVISTPAEQRTGHQRALYLWLQDLVWANEIADYLGTYNEFQKWQGDSCHFTLDPQIASQYGLSYNGAPFCGVSQSSVFNTVIPATSYFKAVGLKRSYQAWAGKMTCPVDATGLQDKSCNVAFQETTIDTNQVAGIALTAASVIIPTAETALIASTIAAYDAFVIGFVAGNGASAGTAMGNALFAVSGACVANGVGVLLAGGGLIATIAFAIGVGVQAGIKAFDYEQSLADLRDVKNQLAAASATPPDLQAMATDTTGLGLFKIQNTIMPKTLRVQADGTLIDLPSTTPLPAHRLGSDLQFENDATRSASPTLSFKGWNGEIWSAQTWGGWFVQTCADGPRVDSQADGVCTQRDSLSADLHYVDDRFREYISGLQGSPTLPSWLTWLSNGSPAFSLHTLSQFSAARSGDKFFATRAGGKNLSPTSGLNTCPASSWVGGVSVGAGTDFINDCWSYVDHFVPMVGADNSRVFAKLIDIRSPTIIGSPVMGFTAGIPSTQTIKVIGDPHPTACIVSSNLPSNFTINGNPFSEWFGTGDCNGFARGGFRAAGLGTVTIDLAFDGALNAPGGDYFLKIKAVNVWNGPTVVTQTFTIRVTQELSILSPDTMNVTSGVPASFTVVATGSPTPTLSVDGVDLGGMTFTDNGNGTATISGIDSNTVNVFECITSSGSGGHPCGLVASNSQGTYRQPFRINLTTPPTARMDCSPCSTKFIAGAENKVLLTSSGATTPVAWVLESGFPSPTPPSWLTMHDNGDGTATLSGTPPYGSVGSSYSFDLEPRAQYTNFQTGHYTIDVVDDTVFTSGNSAAYDAASGTGSLSARPIAMAAAVPNSFTISANTGTISLGTLLPKGLSFASFGNSATITGNPAAGTGGQYVLRVSDDGGASGTADQHLILNVNEAPRITSGGAATLFAGMPASLAVITTGFPSVSTHRIPVNALPPVDPSQGDGMFFTVTGLPASLYASNLNPTGFATGTLTIEGTPTAADIGLRQVQITAQNGVGPVTRQTLMLNIVGITGPAPESGTTCNGNYNGTFRGTITVSAGQNCAFYGGGVTGNMSVNGGTVALTNATVSGNVAIQGGVAFSVGPGTTINGNLSIANVGSGSSLSRICQASVGGNVQVISNAVPIAIGAPESACGPNVFGRNVTIQDNTGTIGFSNNSVGKNLTCSQNASIAGSGNTADKKTGQCSGF